MKTLREILERKARGVCSVTPDSSVFDALKLMAEKDVGALLVLESDRLAGIISERDYARKVVLLGKSSKETPVREIMSADIVCARPQETDQECMARMNRARVRHIPVVEEDGKLLGLVSILDVVEALISDQEATISSQEFTIHQLEGYITGSGG